MHILITGVAGLIGSKFADWIIVNKKDITIIGVDNLSGGYKENINPKVIFHNIDLTDYDAVEKLFVTYKIRIVYHLAAYAAEGLSPFIRKYNYTNNLLITTHLITMAIKYDVMRFVYTSSMATYGFGNGQIPFNEDTPQVPIDPYGIAKLACEMDLKSASDQHNLDYCIIRPHNVYGDNQNIWDKYRNVLGIWMYQLLNGLPITIYGDGKQTRAFSYIDDILEPLWNAGFSEKSKNQTINLGGTIEYSLEQAADILLKIVGKGEKIHLQQRHEVKYAFCTYQKSVDLLEFKMKTSLEEGLTKMWEWAKKQPTRNRKEWSTYELDKGIYDFWKQS